jgi:hypothetical protein
MNEIVDLLLNSGTTIVMLAYFIYRDFKFMQKLDATLEVIAGLIKRGESENV